MVYYWENVLNSYGEGMVLVEADSVEEARELILASEVLGNRNEIGKDMKTIKSTEPFILKKGKVFKREGDDG